MLKFCYSAFSHRLKLHSEFYIKFSRTLIEIYPQFSCIFSRVAFTQNFQAFSPNFLNTNITSNFSFSQNFRKFCIKFSQISLKIEPKLQNFNEFANYFQKSSQNFLVIFFLNFLKITPRLLTFLPSIFLVLF